jgi:chromosome segregation ATPase
MDPAVRGALVDEMDSPSNTLRQELEALEEQISTAREQLKQAEDKEIFLGQRSRQYRKALDERARQLKEEQSRLHQSKEADQEDEDEEDVEDDPDEECAEQLELDQKMDRWERDEDALAKIVETHKQILGHCESMRWTLKELEAKRKNCRSMLGECNDFLEAAEDVRNEIDREADAAVATEGEGTQDAEMTPLSTSRIREAGDGISEYKDDEEPEETRPLDSAV